MGTRVTLTIIIVLIRPFGANSKRFLRLAQEPRMNSTMMMAVSGILSFWWHFFICVLSFLNLRRTRSTRRPRDVVSVLLSCGHNGAEARVQVGQWYKLWSWCQGSSMDGAIRSLE